MHIFSGIITVHYGYIIDGLVVDGQLFGGNAGQSITFSLENNEVVTAFEYYKFPDQGHLKWDLLWQMELCAMSIFTTTTTDLIPSQKQYGPYATSADSTDCEEGATERIYGEIPTSMSFQDFLAQFSIITDKGYIGISSLSWTAISTTTITSTTAATTTVTSAPTTTTTTKASSTSDGKL